MSIERDFPHLGFDPAPGDLDDLSTLVSLVGRVSGEGTSAHTEVNKIGASDGIWVGKAADKFSESVSEIPPYLKKALGSLDEAHRALSSWHTSLTRFQATARRLESEAADAAGRVSTAQGSVDGLPADTEGMSDREKEDHEKEQKGKKRALSDAQGELEDIRTRARNLNGEFDTEARSAARRLREAADDAPPKPNWFERRINDLGNMLENAFASITDPDFWKAIGDFLADAAMVVGILALLGVPGLGWIGLALAGGALLFHGAAFLGGAEGVTWQTLAWDAAGVFAGFRAVKGMRLAKAGKDLKSAGTTIRTLGADSLNAAKTLKNTAGFKAMASNFMRKPWKVKEGLQGLRTGAQNSLQAFREMRQSYRWIDKGNSMVRQGESMISSGRLKDLRWTQGGVGLSGGSNINGRYFFEDGAPWYGDWNTGDIPLVGTAPKVWDFVEPNRDLSQPLASAGTTFDSGISPRAGG